MSVVVYAFTVTEVETIHPLASITSTVYKPGERLRFGLVALPLLQL